MRRIVVLARAPSSPGKTRLTARLSGDRACDLRTALLLDTLDVARTAGAPITISYTPDSARDEMARLAPDARLEPQCGDDLGQRMQHALAQAAQPAHDVVLIGSDLPALPPSRLDDAFYVIERGTDIVFGPAGDGGYYLVGVSQRCAADRDAAQRLARIFVGIAWSAGDVLTMSLAAAHRAGFKTDTVAAWRDVDTRADLEAVLRTLPPAAARVRAWCERSADWRSDGDRTDAG